MTKNIWPKGQDRSAPRYLSIAAIKKNMEELHKEMDDTLESREHKLEHAIKTKDTSTQWDLIAAAVVEAVINSFKLEGKEAKKMRGRS